MPKKLCCTLLTITLSVAGLTAHALATDQQNSLIPTISQLLLNQHFSGEVQTLHINAVAGESILLADHMFPQLKLAREAEIEDSWDKIDAIYEFLGTLPIPSELSPETVCDNLSSVPGAEFIIGLEEACTKLTANLETFSNLQEVVNYAADYLWQSNDTQVALVTGNGIAMASNEGVATISVTDSKGNHTHDIIINVQRVIQTINVLEIQNDTFVAIEEGTLQSFNPDGTIKAEAAISLVSYDSDSGELILSGPGAYLTSEGQLLTIAPCDLFPDGMLRKLGAHSDNGNGTVTQPTEEGSLAEAIKSVDLEHRESVSSEGAVNTENDNDIEGASVTMMAPGVKALSSDAFRKAVAQSDRGKKYLAGQKSGPEGKEKDTLLKATLRGDWEPDFAFSFNKTDSQDGETDGWGQMGISGHIGFKMPIHMYLRFSDWKLRRFDAFFKPTQYSDIQITVDGDADIERTLAEVRGPSIKFFIGALPVYVRPIFEISVGGSATGNNVAVNVVDYEVWNTYGVSYTRDRSGADWRPVARYNRKFNDPEIVDGDYSLSAWGQVKPKLRFYGLGGPYARARIGARLTADTSKTDTGENWSRLRSYVLVSTGVAFDITVSVGFLDYTLVDYDKNFGNILSLYREEWNSGGPYVP